MLKRYLILVFYLILFVGCAQKYNINFSQPYKIVIKTNNIAIADSGFIIKADNYKSIQIFSVGKIVLHVELKKEDACINGLCTTRNDFNDRFFGFKHYPNLLDDILDKKVIYKGIEKIKTKNGFEQNIKNRNYDISYKVTNDSIYFKDRKNHILIKLKRL